MSKTEEEIQIDRKVAKIIIAPYGVVLAILLAAILIAVLI